MMSQQPSETTTPIYTSTRVPADDVLTQAASEQRDKTQEESPEPIAVDRIMPAVAP
jgi:hypothetical protein